jgi:hypothetical protein
MTIQSPGVFKVGDGEQISVTVGSDVGPFGVSYRLKRESGATDIGNLGNGVAFTFAVAAPDTFAELILAFQFPNTPQTYHVVISGAGGGLFTDQVSGGGNISDTGRRYIFSTV